MKFMVLQRIWSKQRQAYFEPGQEVDLELSKEEAAAFSSVLKPLEIVEATPSEQPAQPEQDEQVELLVKKARK